MGGVYKTISCRSDECLVSSTSGIVVNPESRDRVTFGGEQLRQRTSKFSSTQSFLICE